MKLRWAVLYGLGALFIGLILWIAVTSYSRRVKVINIADYDRSSRELRLASAMPTCGCLTIARKRSPTFGDRALRGIDWVRRFGSSASEHTPFELRVRMNGRGDEIGRVALDVLTESQARGELNRLAAQKDRLNAQLKETLTRVTPEREKLNTQLKAVLDRLAPEREKLNQQLKAAFDRIAQAKEKLNQQLKEALDKKLTGPLDRAKEELAKLDQDEEVAKLNEGLAKLDDDAELVKLKEGLAKLDSEEELAKGELAKLEAAVEYANRTFTFAFDWAGTDIGDFYEVKAYDTEGETVDFGARFELSAEPGQPCDGTVCSFKLPGLDRGLNATVGQNDVRSQFAGATTARGDRAIEVVASPPVQVTPESKPIPGAPVQGAPTQIAPTQIAPTLGVPTPGSPTQGGVTQGGCGCLLLQVREDVTLKARLRETSRGYLNLKKGSLETIAFDYGSLAGDRYVITAEDDSRPISDFVRIVGQLDRMGCTKDWAVFEPGTLMSVAPAGPTPAQEAVSPEERLRVDALVRTLRGVSCPYQHLRGNMRLLAMVPSALLPDMQSPEASESESKARKGQ
jgi:chaperonin cofactor prefoldin